MRDCIAEFSLAVKLEIGQASQRRGNGIQPTERWWAGCFSRTPATSGLASTANIDRSAAGAGP
jgi:hypothetical protein